MANRIEFTTINPTEFVDALSRYIDSIVLYYGDQRRLTYNTYKKKSIIKNPEDKVAVVSPGEEFRPDLTSKRIYGTPNFWWRILEFNDIKDIFNYKSGITIRLPANIFNF